MATAEMYTCHNCNEPFGIRPIPSGTFITGGCCKKCAQWYQYESGKDGRGFMTVSPLVGESELRWALDHAIAHEVILADGRIC